MLTARQIKANPSDAAHYIKQVLAENAKLREALLNIVYLDKGRWFIGIHGDSDVTEIIGETLKD